MESPELDGEVAAIIDVLTESLLGQPLTLTRRDLAKKSGVPAEVNAARWRTLGHPEIADDAVAFTKADMESLKAAERLIALGGLDDASQEAFIRAVGRTFARLAEWQARAMLQAFLNPESGELTAADARKLGEMLKLGSRIQDNIWRRHLAGAATRLVLNYSDHLDSEPGCAGFVDIVGYTTRSRSMSGAELSAMIERFEGAVTDLITEHGGHVVKTIGDEVFFVVDDPVEAVWLGAELADLQKLDAALPNVRVGVAYGDLHHRLGDVLGPVVNLASRLTSAARPGRCMIDPALAERAKGVSGLRLRRMRRLNVKGFDAVDPWMVRIAPEGRRGGIRGALDDVIEGAREDLAMRLPQPRPTSPE